MHEQRKKATKHGDRFKVECSFCAQPLLVKLTTDGEKWKLIGKCRCQWIERIELKTDGEVRETFASDGPLTVAFANSTER